MSIAKAKAMDLAPGTTYSMVLPYPFVTGNHAVKHARGQHYRTKLAEEYRAEVKKQLASMGLAGSKWRPLSRLKVRLRICPPNRKTRDIDNVLKELCDALTKAGFWIDDSNKHVRSWEIDWLPALPEGAIHLTVSRWEP